MALLELLAEVIVEALAEGRRRAVVDALAPSDDGQVGKGLVEARSDPLAIAGAQEHALERGTAALDDTAHRLDEPIGRGDEGEGEGEGDGARMIGLGGGVGLTG